MTEPVLPVPPPTPSPAYRLNSPGSVALATALGTPVGGGGKQASNWVGAGIGLAVCAPLIAAFILFSDVSPDALFDFQESVDMGQGQEVFYSRGATRNDAQRFGEALRDAGYFDGTAPSGVLIAGKAGGREISFIVGEGVWDDESWMNYVREVAEYVAPAIGGRPLTVRILDENLNEKKRFQVERTRG
jgi:hypothetical protein